MLNLTLESSKRKSFNATGMKSARHDRICRPSVPARKPLPQFGRRGRIHYWSRRVTPHYRAPETTPRTSTSSVVVRTSTRLTTRLHCFVYQNPSPIICRIELPHYKFSIEVPYPARDRPAYCRQGSEYSGEGEREKMLVRTLRGWWNGE